MGWEEAEVEETLARGLWDPVASFTGVAMLEEKQVDVESGVHVGVLWWRMSAACPRSTPPSSLAAETVERQPFILVSIEHVLSSLLREEKRWAAY